MGIVLLVFNSSNSNEKAQLQRCGSGVGAPGKVVHLLIFPEMTEEAEKLIGTGEEEKDDEKEVVKEKENLNGELEMKTDTYDLVILGASGFTGYYQMKL